MTIIRTTEYKGHSEVIDELVSTSAVLNAIAAMLESALRSGEDLKPVSDGVYLLVKRQADDIDFFTSALTVEIENIKKSKLKIRDPHEIVAATALPAHIVNSVVHAATGVLLGSCKPEGRKQNA